LHVNYFVLSLGLNETPSRIAIFLMVSGFRPIASATSSNDFDALLARADKVRVGDQPKDSKRPWTFSPADATRPVPTR
jgi:hypothetical protein